MILRTVIVAALVLFGAAGSQAQVPPTGASGITVVGRGAVRVHADEVRFNASLFVNPRAASAASPAPDIDGAAEAIAKALRDAGVADAEAYLGGFGTLNTNTRTVTGSVRKPTRAGIDALFKTGNAAAAAFGGVGLQNLSLNFIVDDCSAPEARAQDAALADARKRAERVAHAAGVRLGAIVAVNEAFGYISPTANCATRPDTEILANQRNDSASTLGDVFITISATVTYAIVH